MVYNIFASKLTEYPSQLALVHPFFDFYSTSVYNCTKVYANITNVQKMYQKCKLK